MLTSTKMFFRIIIFLGSVWRSEQGQCMWEGDGEKNFSSTSFMPARKITNSKSHVSASLLELEPDKSHLYSTDIRIPEESMEGSCLSCLPVCLRGYLRNFVSGGVLEAERKELLEENDVSFFPSSISLKSDINRLPSDILLGICYILPALDVFQFSLVSKNLRKIISLTFWENYLNFHKQKRWDPTVPPLKVACAFSLFEKGKFQKAAELGLPQAIEVFKKKEKSERTYLNAPIQTFNYFRVYHYGYTINFPILTEK